MECSFSKITQLMTQVQVLLTLEVELLTTSFYCYIHSSISQLLTFSPYTFSSLYCTPTSPSLHPSFWSIQDLFYFWRRPRLFPLVWHSQHFCILHAPHSLLPVAMIPLSRDFCKIQIKFKPRLRHCPMPHSIANPCWKRPCMSIRVPQKLCYAASPSVGNCKMDITGGSAG